MKGEREKRRKRERVKRRKAERRGAFPDPEWQSGRPHLEDVQLSPPLLSFLDRTLVISSLAFFWVSHPLCRPIDSLHNTEPLIHLSDTRIKWNWDKQHLITGRKSHFLQGNICQALLVFAMFFFFTIKVSNLTNTKNPQKSRLNKKLSEEKMNSHPWKHFVHEAVLTARPLLHDCLHIRA